MRRFAALFLILIAALPALAADRKFDADAKAKTIAPFIDDRTVAVLHVDLDAIDVDALLKKADAVTKIDAAEQTQLKAALAVNLEGLKKAGAHEYYVVVSLSDLPNQGPFSVIPLTKTGNAKMVTEVVERMHMLPAGASEEMNGVVVIGGEATVKRVAKMTPTPRPEIAKALTATGEGTVHLILFATTDARKILEEMMPNLPPELGGGSIKVLSRGLQWAAVKVETDPNVNVHAIVQASDATAAKDLSGLLDKAFKAVGKDKELDLIVKDFPNLFDTITPKVEGDRLVLKLDEKTIVTTFKPVVARVRDAAFRMQSTNNMKQLCLALLNYHDTYGAFPAVANFDKAGKPLLSWRVHILPFIEQEQLYKQFHLDEPWDSEHNKKLIAKMPKVYAGSVNAKLAEAGKTTYLGVVDKSTMFTGDKKGVQIRDVTDGTSNTIFIVDVDDDAAAIWTKPEELKLDPKDPQKGMGGRYPNGFLAAFVDGSVRMLPKKIEKETLKALFTRNGGETIPPPE